MYTINAGEEKVVTVKVATKFVESKLGEMLADKNNLVNVALVEYSSGKWVGDLDTTSDDNFHTQKFKVKGNSTVGMGSIYFPKGTFLTSSGGESSSAKLEVFVESVDPVGDKAIRIGSSDKDPAVKEGATIDITIDVPVSAYNNFAKILAPDFPGGGWVTSQSELVTNLKKSEGLKLVEGSAVVTVGDVKKVPLSTFSLATSLTTTLSKAAVVQTITYKAVVTGKGGSYAVVKYDNPKKKNSAFSDYTKVEFTNSIKKSTWAGKEYNNENYILADNSTGVMYPANTPKCFVLEILGLTQVAIGTKMVLPVRSYFTVEAGVEVNRATMGDVQFDETQVNAVVTKRSFAGSTTEYTGTVVTYGGKKVYRAIIGYIEITPIKAGAVKVDLSVTKGAGYVIHNPTIEATCLSVWGFRKTYGALDLYLPTASAAGLEVIV